MNIKELKDIVKGDELRIAKILDNFNCCNELKRTLVPALEQLETHCIKFGIEKMRNNPLTIEEKREYFKMQDKYHNLDYRYKKLKEICKNNGIDVRKEFKKYQED